MKIIGIIGSRDRTSQKDFELVIQNFKEIYKDGDWICSGGCSKGGDRFAEIISQDLGIPRLIFPPRWSEGNDAGFKRNTPVARHSHVLIALVNNDRVGGTEDTIQKFLDAGGSIRDLKKI